MKKCPFCGGEIGENARFCLHCMKPLNEKTVIPPPAKRLRLQPVWITAALALVLGAVILLRPGPAPGDQEGGNRAPALNWQPSFSSVGTPASTQASLPSSAATSTPTGATVPPSAKPSVPTSTPTAPSTVPTAPSTTPTVPTVPTQSTTPSTQSTTPPVTEPVHIHSFTLQESAEKYLKSAATCLAPAQYYYSCECGLKGDDFFSYGEKGGHTVVVDEEVPAGCVTPGLTEGSHCSVCQQVIVAQQKTEPAGHKVVTTDPMMPSFCDVCMMLFPTPTPSISLKWPELPTVQYGRFRIDKCDFWADYNMDGSTFEVILYIEFTNISSSNYVAGVWATISGIEPSDGTSCELAPGESGTCRVTFLSVPAGDHTVSFE